MTCGGAYIKLPRAGEASEISKLDSDTPYTIMFGPDRCGSNNKVHFIIQYQNPVNLEWEEKHLNETIPIRSDKKTHLYSLVIHKDSRFEIFIDSVSVKKGSLLTHMAPAINPPAEIDDPTDTKPVDWVDEAQIVDASAVKPDDWDETQPRQIPDPKVLSVGKHYFVTSNNIPFVTGGETSWLVGRWPLKDSRSAGSKAR